MNITYRIDENDLLTYQLFIASISERIKKKRKLNRLYPFILYSVVALLSLMLVDYLLAILFLILAVLWFFIYPLWERKRYISHYRGFIRENFVGKDDVESTLEITKESIIVKDPSMESKISTSEIEIIYEIPTAILIKLTLGASLILPIDKITEIENVRSELKELARQLEIDYVLKENWEWK